LQFFHEEIIIERAGRAKLLNVYGYIALDEFLLKRFNLSFIHFMDFSVALKKKNDNKTPLKKLNFSLKFALKTPFFFLFTDPNLLFQNV